MKTPAFNLAITPSVACAAYLIALHILIGVALMYLALTPMVLTLLLILIMFHSVYCLWRYCSAGHTRWVDSVEYSHQVWLLHRGGDVEPANLKSATVWRWMIVLNFVGESRACHSIVLLPDSSSSQQLRRLRVLLKHRPVYGSGLLIP